MEPEKQVFAYCNKVDLHALDLDQNLKPVVALAIEHGFRAIVVPHVRIPDLVAAINTVIIDKEERPLIVPVAAVDYPFGTMPQDVRSYSIMSARECGAKEVEIVAPYAHLANKSFDKVNDDVKTLQSMASKTDVVLRYVVDQYCDLFDDGVKSRLYRLFAMNKVKAVSTSLGFYEDDSFDHSDNILKMRHVKNKTAAQVKSFIRTTNPAMFALYPKAGSEIMGVEWQTAPSMVHKYEEMVQTKYDMYN
jgi:deoxyribose-phosphate aldolase